MNDAWLKAELEGALNALKRIEHEDIPKLKRLLERIATIRGVEVEDWHVNLDGTDEDKGPEWGDAE